MDLNTGDKIRIFENTDVDSYRRFIKEQGFRARLKGDYLIIGEPYARSEKKSIEYGKQIRRARRDNSMTRQELADAVGVTTETVFKWEIGRQIPRDWKKVQKVLGIRG